MSKTIEIKPGVQAPDFTLMDQNNRPVTLSGFKGKWVVLYFYPKDNTPGCTKEACDFSANRPVFDGLDAVILGVSADSAKSHLNFAEKQNLHISLLSDPNHEALEKYGPWQQKNMFGKLVMGIVRTTFLIDPEGKIAHIWTKVKVNGHAEQVKKKLEELKAKSE